MTIDKFRIQISLGSKIESVTPAQNEEGITIKFAEGDICKDHPDYRTVVKRYTSELVYKCHLSDLDGKGEYEVERPQLVSMEGCHAKFIWLTKKACPECRRSQVQETRGRCEHLSE